MTSPSEALTWKANWPAAAALMGVVVVIDLNRYLKLDQTMSLGAPPLHFLATTLVGMSLVVFLLISWSNASRVWQACAFVAIVATFILLKSPVLSGLASSYLARVLAGNPANASAPLSWLGFSYLAFRLLHTIRDRQTGRLPAVTLAEYVNYVIFFPSFTAGPIDRLERFANELRTPLALADKDWLDAGGRLFIGLFKKFVIADLLAVISISDVLVANVRSSGWMWVFLYAYAFRIYFDFSGYTDVAIGMGRLMGIRLPENFRTPYLQPNLTQFWNSWHMTLTQWFRSYFFNPLTRALRTAQRPLAIWLVVLVTQVATMLLIGLWHGVTTGFVMWGLWHGLGLFIQNRWTAFARNRVPAWVETPPWRQLATALGVFMTFNFVSLGWLFFELSSPAIAWQALLRLAGRS